MGWRIIQVGQQNAQVGLTAGTSVQIAAAVSGDLIRTSFIIENISPAGVLTAITKSDVANSSGVGFTLDTLEKYDESTDDRVECWQGAIQCYPTGNGTISVSQSFGRKIWEKD